jgi:hypothetical protein
MTYLMGETEDYIDVLEYIEHSIRNERNNGRTVRQIIHLGNLFKRSTYAECDERLQYIHQVLTTFGASMIALRGGKDNLDFFKKSVPTSTMLLVDTVSIIDNNRTLLVAGGYDSTKPRVDFEERKFKFNPYLLKDYDTVISHVPPANIISDSDMGNMYSELEIKEMLEMQIFYHMLKKVSDDGNPRTWVSSKVNRDYYVERLPNETNFRALAHNTFIKL